MKSIPTSPDPAGWRGHVVLCGLGGAGVRIVEGLLLAGARVVVVDNGPLTPFRQALADQGVPVIFGDCTLIPTLEAAGVRGASAVIAMVNNDMVNLRAALAARELSQDARIVARLFNLRIARHLRDLPARVIALSLSATAAPMFSLAATCKIARGAFTASERLWAVGSLVAPGIGGIDRSVERWRQCGLVILACSSGSTTRFCPPPTFVPPAGSALLVATSPERLRALDRDPALLQHALGEPQLLERVAVPPPVATARPRTPPRQLLRQGWRRANRALRLTVLTFLVLFALSVVAFHFFYPLTFVDALYFTTALVTTVGLGDFNFQHSATPLKLYGTFLMIGGALLLTLLYGLVVEFVLSQRLEALLGTRSAPGEGHYVVAGLGTVGFRVASALQAEGEEVVVIETSEGGRFVPQLRELGIGLVIGDAALEETLRRAGADRARAFVAVTNDDLVNIDAALNAASLRAGLHVVCRVFDLELARQIRDGLAIDSSFSSAQIAAPAFVRAALGHEGPQLLRLPLPGAYGHPTPWVLLTQVLAVAGDEYACRTVGEIATAAGGAAVLHLQHNDPEHLQFAPAPATTIRPGDALLLAISGDNAPDHGEPAAEP